MLKFFGAWIDKSLLTCVFIKSKKQNFTIGELQAYMWYLETFQRIALGEEMDEQAFVVAKTPLPNDLSNDDLQPKVPVEEVNVAPTKKKLHKKKLKKSDVMETKVKSLEDVAPFVPEFVLPAANIDLFAVPNYPAKLLSLSVELFAPSEHPCRLPHKEGLTYQTFHFLRGCLRIPT